MENKTTTELLDLLEKLVDKKGNLAENWQEVYDELIQRTPFNEIFPAYENGESMKERIDELEEDIKLLKRHKHEERSGDVMIRI